MRVLRRLALVAPPQASSVAMTRPRRIPLATLACALSALTLAGCASFSSDGGLDAVAKLTRERIGQPVRFGKADASPSASMSASTSTSTPAAASASALTPAPASTAPSEVASQIAAWLAQPLDADSAVRIALLNNPGLQAGLAELGVAEADLVQSGRLRNPGLSFGRVRGGGDSESDRSVMFDLAGLLTLPARQGIERRRFEQAQLQAAARAVQLAADTRRAYFSAVAAQQGAQFMEQARLAAEASAELARRMAKAGNWGALDQAREELFHADAMTQYWRARQHATATREQLIRHLGLTSAQTLVLPERLPDLPQHARAIDNIEAQALAQRLDVRLARRDSEASASALGLSQASAFVNVLDLGYANKSVGGQARENGYQVGLELPLFDWGGARVAKAEALYMQSLHRTADTALRAQSEVREAYAGYAASYELARHYRDTVVPLRKRMSDQVLLRYNGMLSSVFELLADAREQIASVNAAIDAQRDFWIADTTLQAAIHGGAPHETRTTP